MDSWRDVEVLSPVCGEWRASGPAPAIEDFTSRRSVRRLVASDRRLRGPSCGAAGQAAGAAELRAAISTALAELHSVFSDYDQVTAAGYINDKLLVPTTPATPIGGPQPGGAAPGDGGW
jgi:hypothetical protein